MLDESAPPFTVIVVQASRWSRPTDRASRRSTEGRNVRSRRSGRRAGSRWGTGCLSTAGRPVIQVVVGIIVEVREEASSAVAPVGETLVTGAPANEAAPEFSASRNVHAEAATAAESTDVAARMTSRHDSPCRIASGRECEESSEQEDRQATVSIPCGRHGHSMSNAVPSTQGGGTAEGLVTSRLVSRSGSRCRTTTPTRQQLADMSAGPWTGRCPASYP